MNDVFFISGLGADRSVFKNINLINCNAYFIECPKRRENLSLSLPDYVKLISRQIHVEDPILIGLSFGGLIAQHLKNIVNPKLTILISSFELPDELPTVSIYAKKLNLVDKIPNFLIPMFTPMHRYFFGPLSKEAISVLKPIIRNTDPLYFKWSLKRILEHKKDELDDSIIRIHGLDDRLIPIKLENQDYILGGSHFLVFDKGEELSRILNSIISGCEKI